MPHLAQDERARLCTTLERVGPDQPTLDPPWLTRDLAAHLVIRERRPDASLLVNLPPTKQRGQAIQDRYAAMAWPSLVELVRSGPPAWSPARLGAVDELANTFEMFVHHEDVLRGGPAWEPREVPDDLQSALWGQVGLPARLSLRQAPVGVVLTSPGRERKVVKKPTDQGSVTISGAPGEVVLYAFGRRGVAEVELDGPQAAVTAFTSYLRRS